MMFNQQFVLTCFFLFTVSGYNIDTDFPIIYQMENKNQTVNYFGMSVTIRPKAALLNNSWSIQIGAPRDNISGINIREPGAVYRCHTFGPCKIFLLDKNLTGSGGKESYAFKEKKDGAFIGVTMDIKIISKHERAVVCGNRWINKNLKNPENIDVTYLMTGVCYLQDLINDTVETSVQRLLPLVNADKIYTPKPYIVDLSTYHWGLGQAGISVQLLEEPQGLIIGAPGVTHWIGSVIWYGMDFKKLVGNFAKTEISRKNRYTYLGYSVAAGRFYKDKQLWIATGAPRSGNYHGEVFTFQYKGLTDAIIIRSSLSGSTFGEYFGSSLITSDLNADGFDDLIVGAPLYSDKEPDQGRIYVYLGSDRGNFLLKSQVINGRTGQGRFGTCLASLKDLDQDGYNDVAVGAPYENDQKGAVYIYRGFSLGLQTEYAQHIRAQDVFPYLRGFGISISPAVDIDGNKYRDIAVGSFLSDHVVLFRSRAVILLHSKIKTEDNFYIDRKASFFNVTLCSLYTGSNAPIYADVLRTFNIDPIHKRGSLQNSRTIFSHRKLIRLVSSEISCEIYTIYLDLSSKNYSPLQIILKNEVSSCLKTKRRALLVKNLDLTKSDRFLKWCATGNKAETSKEIAFAGVCGVDDICRSDLKLSCDIPEFRTGFYVIGSSEYFVLSIHLKNLGEPAYNTKIKIWSNIKLIHHNYKLEGLAEIPRNTYWFDIDGTIAEYYQGNFSFKIALDTLKEILPVKNSETNLILVVEVFTSTVDVNENNKFRFSVKLLSDAAVNLYYSSSLSSFFVSQKIFSLKQNTSLNFTHYYEVIKKGVTPIKVAELTIYVPSYFGEELLTFEIETANWMQFSTNYQVLENNGSNYTGTHVNTYGSVAGVGDKFSNRILFLNCSESALNQCRILKIFFTKDIPVGVSSYVKLHISLNVSAMDSIKEEKDIVLFTTSAVLRYSEIFESESKELHGSASTSLYTENMRKSVSCFVIAISLIAGGLLFSLILAGLIKCDFFKRAKKQELKALKEAESNFIYFATGGDFAKPNLEE